MSMGILLTSCKPVHLKYDFYFYGATFVFMWSFQGSCFKGELIFLFVFGAALVSRPWDNEDIILSLLQIMTIRPSFMKHSIQYLYFFAI